MSFDKLVCKKMNCFSRGKAEKKTQHHKKGEKLPRSQRAAHGVGHVLNDLISGVWFSYAIIYLTMVVDLSNRHTGLVILLGQITDAIFTPFIGITCDRTVCRYGRRKLWHLIGSVLVTASFPLLLIRLLDQKTSDLLKMVYYVGIAAVIQFGWGSVQISHLSLIPEISRRPEERVELNAIRSAMTFLCGIYVYGVTWVLLGQSSENKITPNIWKEFMYLAFIVIGTGNICNIIFHVVIREPLSPAYKKRQQLQLNEDENVSNNASVLPGLDQPSLRKELVTQSFENKALESHQELEYCCKNLSNGGISNGVINMQDSCVTEMGSSPQCCHRTSTKPSHNVTASKDDGVTPEIFSNMSSDCVTSPQSPHPKTKLDWLRSLALHKTAVVYMCSRLVVNISQSYLALYLTETLNFEKEAIAYFPLVVLISGVLSSLVVKTLNRNLGSRITYALGATLSLGACAWFYLQAVDTRNGVYAATVLMGSGGSVMLVTSLSMIADLIGEDKTSGAFIYGAISFCDKLSSGIVIAIIQELNPRDHQMDNCPNCNQYVRHVQSIAPGAAAVVGLITVVLFYKSIFVCRRKVEFCDAVVQVNLEQNWTEKQDVLSITDHLNNLVPSTSDCVAQIHGCHDNKIVELEIDTRF